MLTAFGQSIIGIFSRGGVLDPSQKLIFRKLDPPREGGAISGDFGKRKISKNLEGHFLGGFGQSIIDKIWRGVFGPIAKSNFAELWPPPLLGGIDFLSNYKNKFTNPGKAVFDGPWPVK